ncbi:MAG TPA: excinuclease ABC subunit UvrB [Candidatus Limnocylindrales bacterium]
MPDFHLVADFQPTGDQPAAIDGLVDGLQRGLRHQVLLGATGTGKTFTVAQAIARQNRPTLVLAHNKTLAAQLYSEFREFFPENAVEYFVSYFDYYQPEAYLPRSDTYIEKDSNRNEEIDKLRHAATKALFERRDVIIVASVSCIYGLGAPVDYGATVLRLRVGGQYRRDAVLRQLVDLQYQRNDQALTRSRFRVRGDTLELVPASEDRLLRVEFFGDEVERITELDGLTGELLAERKDLNVYPATHFVTPADKLKAAIVDIEAEMEERCGQLEAEGRVLEAARLRQRTTFDLEMMRELGFCSGIENYSRHLARREAGSRPWTLLDYFPPDWLLVVDESHMTIPQVVGMYKNDRTRKEILVDFGFRLPSALDNRPLTFEEFEATVHQAIYLSATPGPYELERSERVVEQLIRPTGIVDPAIDVRPTEGQIDDLLDEIRARVERGERSLVTTLTKKMAEDLADYLRELGVKVQYLHSEVDTLERVAILRDLRLGVYDVVVGINLLREGIDLPEVTLVAILDADKEGFLRSAWSLIQMIGRAARNIGGSVVMYADTVTESMRAAIDETKRRREIQERYNREHGIEPVTIVKGIRDINDRLRTVAEASATYGGGGGGRNLAELDTAQVEQLVAQLEAEMRSAARQLEFERAAALRDEIQQIRLRVLEQDASVAVVRAAERAARGAAAAAAAAAAPPSPASSPTPRRSGRGRGAERGTPSVGAGLEVTTVTVLPTGEDPAEALDAELPPEEAAALATAATASDWLPGIRDEHDDEAGWQARWLERPTWDRTTTPNVIRRTGQRPGLRPGRRRRG